MRRSTGPTLPIAAGVLVLIAGRARGFYQPETEPDPDEENAQVESFDPEPQQEFTNENDFDEGFPIAPPSGQPDGPVVITPDDQSKYEGWVVTDMSFDFDFYSRYQHDQIKNAGAADQNNSELQFRETLGFFSRSYIGHPNLIDLTADISIGYEDTYTDYETPGTADGHDRNFVDEFDISALILGQSALPTTVYATRNESLYDREFSGSIDSLTTEYGAYMRTQGRDAATTLHIFNRQTSQQDQLGLVDDDLEQTTLALTTRWKPTDNQEISVDYNLDFIDETRVGGINTTYTRNDATAIHTLDFGSEDQHNLRSALRVVDQSGDYPRTTVRLSEILTIEHSRTLESKYFLTLEDNDIQGQKQEEVRGHYQLQHKLFDSLVSTGRVGGSRTRLPDDDYTSDNYFAEVNFDYTKKVPYGRLQTTLFLGIDQTDDSARGTTLSIIDQPYTFNDPFPIQIVRPNIDPNSIVITNLASTITYNDPLDYTVDASPTLVDIYRVVGGAITDGQTVLVDYDIGPDPGSIVTTSRVGGSARYTIEEGSLRGLSFYGDYFDISQNVDSTNPLLIPNNTIKYRMGVDYILRPFAFEAEYRVQDSTVSPYETYHVEGRFDQRLGWNSFFTARATHENVTYTDDDNTVVLNRVNLDLGYAFTRNLDGRFRLLYRDETEDIGGNSQGFEQGVELNWRKGKTTAFVSFRNSILDTDNEDQLSQTLSVGLRRLF